MKWKSTIKEWYAFTFPTLAHEFDIDCGDHQIKEGYYNETFSLKINRSLRENNIEFKFCQPTQGEAPDILIVIANHDNGIDSKHKAITLTEADSTKIASLFDLAWEYNKRDNASGMDGSYWCLSTRNVHTVTKGCFWTPTSKPQKRGLSGLSNLGTFLWEYTELEIKHGAVY